VPRPVSKSQRIGPSVIRLCLFIVVTIAALALLATTISNTRFGEKSDYAAVFTDVTGLMAGDDVRIAGVRVGEITDIEMAGDSGEERAQALVHFTVDRTVVLTEGTTALIRYRNLIGQRYLSLAQEQGSSSQLPVGSTIPVERTKPALDLTALFNGFKPLFAALDPEDVNQLAFEIITVLQGEGGTIEHLLASTASLTTTLADKDEVIGRTIDNLNVVLATVADRSEQLDQLLVQLQRFVSGLAEDREAIGASLTNIADLGESTAGLLEEARPPLEGDVKSLGDLSANIDAERDTVDQFLDTWPGKLEEITRTASYGSWFNFYVCDFTGEVELGAGAEPLPVHYETGTARCKP
jgi:phospholipid/cholesterol/gamma-HCH transport system substrate-binding protein